MPIPDPPTGGADMASTVLALFVQLHEEVRRELRGLDDHRLNAVPAPGMNSVATIVSHLVGSEAETLRSVAGQTASRDRDGEFTAGPRPMADVLAALARADDLVTEVRGAITPARLRRLLSLPTLPPGERRTGLTWLVGNYGHGREHLGHIQLSKQLLATPGPAG